MNGIRRNQLNETNCLSCPFCAKKPRVIEYFTNEVMIHCDCGSTLGLFFTIDDAVNAWNHRELPINKIEEVLEGQGGGN